MKKLIPAICLIFSSLFTGAQTNLYQNLKKIISDNHPEINLENKLIAFNVWSIDNAESREANKAFEKTYTVYERARLKGGSKGIVVVAVNNDNLTSNAVITLTKDGVTKMILVKLEDIQGIEPKTTNAVFDSNGNEVYRNLSSPVIFNSINHLITR